ncbi:MAG TPA: SDR family oxidoreductase [Virgibacillus sp.]|nr:SDR family oxidoreductase [Virgibacillus sp.]
MKVFVIGANGQIGQHVVQQLQNSDEHSVRAMVRSEEQVNAFEKQGVEARRVDLEGPMENIASAAEGCDAIVFTAGSGAHTGADKTMLIDLDGAAKSIAAAEKSGIDRFMMVSAIHADNRDKWGSTPSYYMVAKHHADRILAESDLNYTILRPGLLTNDAGNGKITAAPEVERAEIPREDVAATIVSALNEKKTFKRSFELVSGSTPIEDALETL